MKSVVSCMTSMSHVLQFTIQFCVFADRVSVNSSIYVHGYYHFCRHDVVQYHMLIKRRSSCGHTFKDVVRPCLMFNSISITTRKASPDKSWPTHRKAGDTRVSRKYTNKLEALTYHGFIWHELKYGRGNADGSYSFK